MALRLQKNIFMPLRRYMRRTFSTDVEELPPEAHAGNVEFSILSLMLLV